MLQRDIYKIYFRIHSIQFLQRAARNNGCMQADALHQKII